MANAYIFQLPHPKSAAQAFCYESNQTYCITISPLRCMNLVFNGVPKLTRASRKQNNTKHNAQHVTKQPNKKDGKKIRQSIRKPEKRYNIGIDTIIRKLIKLWSDSPL